MGSNTWSSTWSNMWPTKPHLLRSKQTLSLLLSNSSSSTCHLCIKSLSSLTCYSCSKTLSLSLSLTLSILRKLYEWPLSKACASSHTRYQCFFASGRWAQRKSSQSSSHWQSHEWSGKKMANWTQLDLLLGRQYQSFSIDPLLEDDLFW